MISLIVAFDKNHLIGKENWMPWQNKEDLKHFRNYTLHKDLLVGRKTFEGFSKPLPHRFHYVLTRKEYHVEHPDVQIIHSVDDIIEKYAHSDKELVVIGGCQIYKMMLPYVSKMVISLMEGDFEGDTWFPEYDENDFVLESIEPNDGFAVYTYIRKKD